MEQVQDLAERSKQILKLEGKMAAIRHKLVVLSGKGGVGKTTVAVGLALALARDGYKVGILDTDIHGPNVALMIGLEGLHIEGDQDNIEPLIAENGIRVVSMANLLPDSNTPVIWRGPAKLGAIRQLLTDTNWGELDFLVIDSPPGTGDEPLTVAQSIPNIDGAIIVTTPQNVALLDCRKCINFAHQVKMPVIGVIENMSGMSCPHCGKLIEPFKSGGGQRVGKQMKVTFLGSIPMDPAVVEESDKGKLLTDDNSKVSKAFKEIVKNIIGAINEKTKIEETPMEGSEKVRLAIATENGQVSSHFGHCEKFTLVDVENGKVTSKNEIPAPAHEPGLLPGFIAEKGASVVIAGGMGPRAVQLFEERNIRVIPGVQGSIDQVVKAFLAGKLESGGNLCDSDHGHGECNHGN